LVISIEKGVYSLIWEDDLVKGPLPDPPIPTNNALPLAYLKTLHILDKCEIASMKNTRFIVLEFIEL